MIKTITLSTALIAALLALGFLLTMGIGKPVSTDLSVIGQGKPVLVLAYESFSPNGVEALNSLQQVRHDFDSRLDFVVADLGTPQGRGFASRYKLANGQALFLNQNGQPLRVINIPADEHELRRSLESKLAAVE
ncbi:MAG: hypothetical protein OQK98_15300 [Gammaproteobacteria bacterium]|nr:hypothetical protein [Gammaproteobacteria bacterium]